MSELPNSPLSEDEQKCLVGISQLAGLDAQAKALRVQLGTVIVRAQQDNNFNSLLLAYAYALQSAGQEQQAILATAMCAGRVWSAELADRMRSESGAPPLSRKEKECIWACQRAWDLVHGIKPTPAPLRLFDTPEHTRLALQAIAAIVAMLAFIALMVLLPHAQGAV